MSIEVEKIFAPAPVTIRDQPTPLSTDSKGERIAYASGKSIFLRSIDDPSSCKEYIGHTAQTTVARFSPSGFYIASGDVAGVVRVWDAIEAVNTKGEYQPIAGRVTDIAWDGDSQRILIGGGNRGSKKLAACITADSGNTVGEISGHSEPVNSVALRPMRPMRAATVGDDRSMYFFHGPPFKFNTKNNNHTGHVFGTAFSPDGNTLVTVSRDRKIQLYDGKTAEPTKTIGDGEHTGSIYAVSWAKDSKHFVTASADQTIKLWDVEAGVCKQTWKFGGDEGRSIPDQQIGVVWPHGRSDGLIISLSLNGDLNYLKEGSADPIKIVQGHNKSVTAMAGGSDEAGNTLWTGSFDGKVCEWDVSTGKATTVDGQTHTNQITGLATGPGRAYSVGWDDTLRIADQSAITFTGDASKLSAQPKGVAAAGGRVYIATTDGVEIFANGSSVGQFPISDSELTAIAAHGDQVAVGTNRNAVRIYTVDGSNKLTLAHEASNGSSLISALAFSKNGSHLAAGSSAGKIYVYKAPSLELITERWSSHTARVTSIAWNDAGTYAVSGGLDTNVFVWSLERPGMRVKGLSAHKDGVSGVCWVEGGTKIASTGGNAAVKIWKVSDLP